jgi:signal transduction histidine kinase
MDEVRLRTPKRVVGKAFEAAVLLSTLAFVGDQAFRDPSLFLHPTRNGPFDLLFWTLAVAIVELFPVAVSRVLQLSLSFPILLGVAILYDPAVAATVALVGTFDSRELHGELRPLTALFNRSQIALSVLEASAVFHALASVRSPLYVMLPAVLLASASSYCVNVVLVALHMRLVHGRPLAVVISQMRLGAASQFLMNYLGLGLIGVVIARLYSYSGVGIWSVAAFLLPLVFARQMFFRTMALEEASKELKDREQVLRALSNRMAEERQDERMQIAAYLHDDLAQMLFRLNLQVEMAKKRLATGELDSVLKDLDGIITTKNQTSNAIRALIRDLHRSPIGRKGLAEAMQSLAADISRGSRTSITTDVVEVSLPPPIQLLIYQIGREAAMNALKHAEADNIWISLHERDDGVELQIRDDGKGFDTEAPPPEGHFGSVMMRERAQVAGGTFALQSEMGKGTMITASFPRVWVEEATLLESSHPTNGDGDGSGPGAGPGTEPPDKGEKKRPPRILRRLGRESRVKTPTVGQPGLMSPPGEEPLPDPHDADRDRRGRVPA